MATEISSSETCSTAMMPDLNIKKLQIHSIHDCKPVPADSKKFLEAAATASSAHHHDLITPS
jgi:hypothetical protein